MNLYTVIYCLPLKNVVIVMLLAVIIWSCMAIIVPQKQWQKLNILAVVASLWAIALATILNRRAGASNELVLIPLYSFTEAKIQPEIYRSMLMNCFVFLPFGLSLPFALPKSLRCKGFITILLAAFLSALIEAVQYKFSLGRAEADDVICNTLGAVAGVSAYIVNLIYQRRSDREQA